MTAPSTNDVLKAAKRSLRDAQGTLGHIEQKAKDEAAAEEAKKFVNQPEVVAARILALRAGDAIEASDLNLEPAAVAGEEPPVAGQGPLQDYLDKVERLAILDALQRTRFNRTAAAKILGVTFRSLRYRMERLGLNERDG